MEHCIWDDGFIVEGCSSRILQLPQVQLSLSTQIVFDKRHKAKTDCTGNPSKQTVRDNSEHR